MQAQQTKQEWPVEELWVDTVGVRSVEIDWTERWNDGDGWQSYEAPECGECGEYGRWSSDTYEWVCPNEECEQHGRELELEDGGPMMNYYYPLPDLDRVGDEYQAAERIRALPLCVVAFEDGSNALALTGGGMDLSWEICEAFTRLGFLPPLHFCDLPNLAGKTIDADARYTINACLRTADVAEHQARSTRERLTSQYGGPDA
jgi:hypothetical protein